MQENWKPIKEFPGYSVSDQGDIQRDKTGRILSPFQNQSGLVCVGMMRDGTQYHRSVPLLVAKVFLPKHKLPAFNTPVNLDGDRYNNDVTNLVWRPRWFVVKYNRQFVYPYPHPITNPVYDLETSEESPNSFECAKRYGLLEEDLVRSILNRTYVFPTYQQFGIVE